MNKAQGGELLRGSNMGREDIEKCSKAEVQIVTVAQPNVLSTEAEWRCADLA